MEKIARDGYLNKLTAKMGTGMIKILTGPPQSGKSYLLFELFRSHLIEIGVKADQILTLRLGNDYNPEYRNPELIFKYVRSKVFTSKVHYIFIDEVQLALPSKEIKSHKPTMLHSILTELMKLHNLDIYMTLGASKASTKDIISSFGGMGDEVEIFPLSFGEYLGYIGKDKTEAYEDYSIYGGLPVLASKSTVKEKRTCLNSVVNEIYFGRTVRDCGISRPDLLQAIITHLIATDGAVSTMKEVTDNLLTKYGINVSVSATSRYLKHLSDPFIFNPACGYNASLQRQVERPVRFYAADTGIINTVLNFSQKNESLAMKTIIYNELRRRGYCVHTGISEILERGSNKKCERKQYLFDFVAIDGTKKYYIQTNPHKYSTIDELRSERIATVTLPLVIPEDFYKKIVITKCQARPWRDNKGILYLGLYEFLLNENSLNL